MLVPDSKGAVLHQDAAMFQLDTASLASLFQALRRRGYRPVGPTVRDGAIVCEEIASPDRLPAGWTEEQSPGRYRLARRDDDSLFGFTLGPQSWKKFLLPPERTLWKARLSDGALQIRVPEEPLQTADIFVGPNVGFPRGEHCIQVVRQQSESPVSAGVHREIISAAGDQAAFTVTGKEVGGQVAHPLIEIHHPADLLDELVIGDGRVIEPVYKRQQVAPLVVSLVGPLQVVLAIIVGVVVWCGALVVQVAEGAAAGDRSKLVS